MCHTPLISCIFDLPEQCMKACINNNWSPVTLAITVQFGDKSPHPPHTCSHTHSLIKDAFKGMDPALIPQFIKTCQPLGLNNIHQLFWKDWGQACPSQLLAPNMLHQLHKFFLIMSLNGLSISWAVMN